MAPGVEAEAAGKILPTLNLNLEGGEDNAAFINITLTEDEEQEQRDKPKNQNDEDEEERKIIAIMTSSPDSDVEFDAARNKKKSNTNRNLKKIPVENPPGKNTSFFKRYRGLGLGFLSSFIFSLAALAVKLLSSGHHPVVICLWTFYAVFLGSVVIVSYGEIWMNRRMFKQSFWPLWEKERLKCIGALFARATFGSISYVLFTMSLNYMSLSDSIVITLSTPVFVIFLARLFLKEHCGLMNVLAAIVTLAGVVIIVRPPFLTGGAAMDINLLIGAGMALGAMSSLTFVYLCLRVRAVKKLHFSMVTLVYGFIGSVECAILALCLGTFEPWPSTSGDWLLAAPMAFATFFGHVCATLACKFEEAGIVALTRTFDVVFASIWQFFFLGISPNIFSLIGSLVIISGIVFVLVQKYLRNLPKDNVVRKRLNFIL